MMSKFMRCSVTIWLFCLSILFVLLVHDQNTYVTKRVGYTVGFNPRNIVEKKDKPKIIGGMDAEHLKMEKEEAETEEEEEDEPPPLLTTTQKTNVKEEKNPTKEEEDKEETSATADAQENGQEKEQEESGEEKEQTTTTVSQKVRDDMEKKDEEEKEKERGVTKTTPTVPVVTSGQKKKKNEANSGEEEDKPSTLAKTTIRKKEDIPTKTTVNTSPDDKKKDKETTKKVTIISRAARLLISSTDSPKEPENNNTVEEEIDEKYETLPELRFHNSSKAFSKKYYPLLEELGLTGNVDYIDLKKPLPDLTLVSAVSENHAGEGRSMVARLAKDHPDLTLILYDMGLKNETRTWFDEACNVEVRDINLTHFGVASNLKTYRWKAVIIADALLDFPVVFWIDSSTFLSTNMSLTEFIEEIGVTQQKTGPHAYLLDETTHHSTFAVTVKGMYNYLSPQRDYFQQQYQANKMLFFRTKETYELALKWYVLCSLEAKCMAPPGHQVKCNLSKDDAFKKYANCHRYDQSAINLVLLSYETSLLGNWTLDYTWTKRGNERNMSPLICDKKDEE